MSNSPYQLSVGATLFLTNILLLRRSFRLLLRHAFRHAFPAADQCQSILGIEWELPERRLTSRAQRNIHAAIACKNNRSQISESPLTLFRAQMRIVLERKLYLGFAQNM